MFGIFKKAVCNDSGGDCMPSSSHLEQLYSFEKTITDVASAIDAAKQEHEELKRAYELLEAMIYAAGGYVWLKDVEGIYKWCDHLFCEQFFGLERRSCNVSGLSDVDLINDFRERTGQRHSFGELCFSTDQHCLKRRVQSRYIEVGYIGSELFVLDVVKTPLFTSGGATSIVGFAWNRSTDCIDLLKQIGQWTEAGRVDRLMPLEHADGADVGVWFVRPCSTNYTCSLNSFFNAEGGVHDYPSGC